MGHEVERENDTAISVNNVSKTFKLPHEKQTSLKGIFLSSFRKKSYEKQHALKNVSFEIKKGEFFGIVGRNGSGKSTLLKLIAGIYVPDSGSIKINGSLTPFIELGVGFNPELTGRENVFLNGAMLGFDRKQMLSMYDEIVEFAELNNFMDQKLNNYSSGMQVRLAFSIAIRAKSSILLLDEVLAVGDAAFQQKCNDYFAKLKRDKSQTIILVSHSMGSIEKYCNRAMLLNNGSTVHIGQSPKIAEMYEDMVLKEGPTSSGNLLLHDEKLGRLIEAKGQVLHDGKESRVVEAFKDLKFSITLLSKKDFPDIHVAIYVRNSEGVIVFAVDSVDHIEKLDLKKNIPKKLLIEVDNIFTNGSYSLNLNINGMVGDIREQLFKKRNLASFTVFGVRRNLDSVVHPHCKVKEIDDEL